jgi:hypothetical protein
VAQAVLNLHEVAIAPNGSLIAIDLPDLSFGQKLDRNTGINVVTFLHHFWCIGPRSFGAHRRNGLPNA